MREWKTIFKCMNFSGNKYTMDDAVHFQKQWVELLTEKANDQTLAKEERREKLLNFLMDMDKIIRFLKEIRGITKVQQYKEI